MSDTVTDDYREPSAQDTLRGVLRFLKALNYRRTTVAWAVAGALLVAGVYYATAIRYYESTAKLQIVYQDPDSLSVSDDLRADDVMTTHRELVRTARVVGEAIERLAPEHRVDLRDLPPSEWVREITAHLSANTIRKTKLISVGYRSRSPEAAAAVVDAIINSYLAYVAETHRGTAAELFEETKARIAKNKLDRTEKQQQLVEARRAVGDLRTDPADGVVDPLITRAVRLNEKLVEATGRRVELESSLAIVWAAIQRGDDLRQHLGLVEEAVGTQLLMSSLGIGEQDLRSLGEQQQKLLELRAKATEMEPFYGPNHPEIVTLGRQIASIQKYVSGYHANTGQRFEAMSGSDLAPLLTAMLTRSVEQARRHEAELHGAVQEARSEAATHSSRLLAVADLQRELERLDDQYDQLFARSNSIDPHQVQAPIRASIVQEPLPALRPATPKLAATVSGALLLGLVVGCATAYVQDLIDDRFNSPDEISQQLGLPVLSIIRRFEPLDGNKLDSVHAFAGVDSMQSEAFRTLRTALSIGADSTDRLAVSSAEPSDGKTTVCVNLAVSFAQAGKRTLVIDTDLRKPGMTTLMEVKGQPGVTDLLMGEGDIRASAEKCVRSTKQPGLDFIPAGPRRTDAAELLSGPRFAELLSWADTKYDQLLIDCPPVLAVSDAQVIGQLVDGVMLVVSPEKNHRRLVARACEAFLTARINVFGVVANQISDQSGQEYGYGYGYGYGEEAVDTVDGVAWHRAA
ncbi:MAG: polysaccharide biosynthesis tyrosine autokinase [Planctomycetota bacterium]